MKHSYFLGNYDVGMDKARAQEILEHASNLAYLIRHADFIVREDNIGMMAQILERLHALEDELTPVVRYLAKEV